MAFLCLWARQEELQVCLSPILKHLEFVHSGAFEKVVAVETFVMPDFGIGER